VRRGTGWAQVGIVLGVIGFFSTAVIVIAAAAGGA